MRILLAILFVYSAPAFAANPAPKEPVCPAWRTFYLKILNCGKNPVAVNYARICEQSMVSQADHLTRTLTSSMAQLSSGRGQKSHLAAVRQRLEKAIDELGELITTLQANTDIVADYTNAMIDDPSSTEESTSLECFNRSFRALQAVVSRLDSKIIEAKAAREKAISFMTSLVEREGSLGGATATESTISTEVPVPRPRPIPR